MDKIERTLQFVSSIALVAMMIVVVTDVTLRFVFNTPVRGAYDIVSFALLIMVFFGIGPVIVAGKEIVMDLFDHILPGPALKGLRIIAAIGTLAIFLFISWSMIGPAVNAWRYGDRSLELNLPVWMLWVCALTGLVGILISAFAALISVIASDTQPPSPNDAQRAL